METDSHIADTTFCQFLKLNNDICDITRKQSEGQLNP